MNSPDPSSSETAGLLPLRIGIAQVAIVGLCLDQMTKAWAVRNLDPADPPSFLGGFLKFRLIFNSGAAFSMGSQFTVALTIFAIVALLVVGCWLAPRVRTWRMGVVCGLLLAGIAGNLTDRLFRPPGPFKGHVVDFISLPHFAIFNVADICITVAAAGFVAYAIFGPDDQAAEQSPASNSEDDAKAGI